MAVGKLPSRMGRWSYLSVGLALLLAGCTPKEEASRPMHRNAKGEVEVVTETTPPPSGEIAFAAQDRRIPVLMFHDIVARRTKANVWFDCSEDEFRQAMDRIAELGLTPISVADLYAHLAEGKSVPERAICLTFDDNYQGFYDHAWPILKERGYPAMMFVHTRFVGEKAGVHPKMGWETLRQLVKNPLFTVGSHTVNHYLDLADRPDEIQRQELEASKTVLEEKLGTKIDFLAYPNGSNSKETQLLARQLGYKLAFTTINTPAEESPSILAVGRYVHTRLEKAVEDAEVAARSAPAAVFRAPFTEAPITYRKTVTASGVEISLVEGGKPRSVMSSSREGVKAFVERENGVAGINGGFFAMAAIRSDDNRMVGPVKTHADPQVIPDDSPERWAKIRNRPLVLWSDKEFAILPFIPETMRTSDDFPAFLPDVSDVMLAGVWLVHNGVAQPKEAQNVYGSKDIQDPRRRAAMGITSDGRFVIAAARGSISSANFADALAAAGVAEAVLLDSGFSTSLVFDGKIKVSGHSSPDQPSRPVPHAIVVLGEKDASATDAEDLGAAKTSPRRKRKARR